MPLFVSCVPGRPSARFGTGGRGGRGTLIGAERLVAGRCNEIQWFPERVVLISDAEFRRYGREYRRCLAAGDLRLRTEADYRAAQGTADEAAAAEPKQAKKSKEHAG